LVNPSPARGAAISAGRTRRVRQIGATVVERGLKEPPWLAADGGDMQRLDHRAAPPGSEDERAVVFGSAGSAVLAFGPALLARRRRLVRVGGPRARDRRSV